MCNKMDELGRLVAMLKEDLRDAWEENHGEHCGCDRAAGRECHWQPALTLQTGDVSWLDDRRKKGEDAPYLGEYFRYGDLAMVEVHEAGACVVAVQEREVSGPSATVGVPDPAFAVGRVLGPEDAVVHMFGIVPEHAVVKGGSFGDSEG